VVVQVDLSNFDPVRGRITLNLTANRTVLAQRTVTVGVDTQRTVYLRTRFDSPGRYGLQLNDETVGNVLVTAVTTETPTVSPSPEPTLVTDALTPTPSRNDTGTPPPTSGPASVGTATQSGTTSLGPDRPSRIDIIVAGGMTLLLLYGVGVAVYVLRERPPT
jgi:hypothetical protein